MADGYFSLRDAADPVEMFEGIVRRTLGTTDEAMICEFVLQPGAIVPEHQHMNDQVGYVVRGKLEMTVGGETHTVCTGDSYAIPGGVLHSAVAQEETVIVDAFSPPRNDYRTEAR